MLLFFEYSAPNCFLIHNNWRTWINFGRNVFSSLPNSIMTLEDHECNEKLNHENNEEFDYEKMKILIMKKI